MYHTNRQRLDHDWLFDDTPVTVPHSWNATDTMAHGSAHYARRVGVYRRDLPPTPAGKRCWLEFEAVSQAARVYAGETWLGEHYGGYTPFTVEVTGHSDPLTVYADNRPDPDLIPSDMSDFFLYGGITRPVWTYTTGPACIKSLFLESDVDEESVTLAVAGRIDGAAERLRLVLTGPWGGVVIDREIDISGETFQVRLPALRSPWLWSPDTPNLYTLTVTLYAGDSVSDAVVERTGFRWFETHPGGPFHLNGEPLLLRGTHRHEDWAGYASAVPDHLTRREMQLIKDAGFNFIRLGHYPQAPLVLDLCDELGILVWEEIPWCRGGIGGDVFRQRARAQLCQMVERDYNRPSVIFWGLGNELDWESEHADSSDDRVLNFLMELHQQVHRLDPHRLTAIRRFEPGADVVDIYSPSIWDGWYRGRYRDYEQSLKAGLARYGNFFHAEWGGDSHAGRHTHPPECAGDWSETYILDLMEWHLRVQVSQPDLIGTAQWAFKDFGTPLRPENPLPYVNQKGLVTRDGTPKDAYYLFQAYQTDKPVIHIESSGWDVRLLRPDQPETVRVYSNCETVELFVNEWSLGAKTRDEDDFPAAGLRWTVTMWPGEVVLYAVGTCGATAVSHTVHQQAVLASAGPVAGFTVTVEAGRDDWPRRIVVQLVDGEGVPVYGDERRVHFDGPVRRHQGVMGGSDVVETATGRATIAAGSEPVRVRVDGVDGEQVV